MRVKFGALVSVNDVRDTKARDELIEKDARDRNRLLIQHCISFYVFCKVVNDSHDVPINTLRAGQRAYNVHCDSVKWCFSVD